MFRRFMRRITLLSAVVAGALVTGATAQEIVLDFPSWQATEPGTSDWYRELIAAFESRHPNLRIEFTHEPFAGYNEKMVTRFAGNNPPDIFHLPAANFHIYAQEGWLEPLDAYLAGTDIQETWPPLQETCVYQGETLCLLVLGYGYVLGYNQAAFEEAGMTQVPRTSDELLEAAKALTVDLDGDGTIDRYGFVFPTVSHPGVMNTATAFLFEYGPDAHWVDEQGNLNRPAITYALEKMKAFVDAGVVPMGLDNNGKRQFFIEGRAALMEEGPWIQGFIDSAPEDVRPHLRVAPLPYGDAVFGGASNVLGIPRGISEEKKALVWEFIELVSSPEWQRKYAEVAGQPPAREGVLDEAFLEENPNMRIYVEAAMEARDYFPPGMEETYTQFRDLAIDTILAVAVQGQPIDQALDELERSMRRIR